MRRQAATIAASLIASLCAGGTARALEKDLYDLSLDELSELVITDTKIGQTQDTVTQKVELFYPRDFDQQPTYHGTLAELLTYASGQFVNPLSRNDPNWGSFGGLGPKYNGYLLDGLPIDSFADAMGLDSWALGQVESHKGPASIMYSNYLTMDFAGNETPLAGITNLVLRDKIDAPATRLMVGGGSYETVSGRSYHQNRVGNLNYFVGASYEQSSYADYGTADSWLHIMRPPRYEKTRLYAKLTYLFDRDDHKLSLFVNHAQQSGNAGRANRDFTYQYDTVNVGYFNQLTEAWNLQVKSGFRGYERRWGEDNFPTDLGLREHDGARQWIFPSDVTLNLGHAGRSVFTVGADAQLATYRTYAEVEGVRHRGNDVFAYSIGTFVQEKLVLESWVFRLGGRFNHTGHAYDRFAGVTPGKRTNSWDTPLWSAGVRYNPTSSVALYGNAGSSFVAPSAKQLGGTLAASSANAAGANGQLPNLELRPEAGVGSDLGVELRPIDGLSIGVRGFYSRVTGAIVENVVSATPSQSKSMNVGTARSLGCEVSLEHQVAEYLRWFANYTYTTTRVENSRDADQNGANIPFVPQQMANAGMTARLPLKFYVSPYVHVVGAYYDSTSKSSRRRFGPYPVLSLRAQNTLIEDDTLALHAAVDLNNLLDKRYEMPWQFQDPGFNAFASLDLTF